MNATKRCNVAEELKVMESAAAPQELPQSMGSRRRVKIFSKSTMHVPSAVGTSQLRCTRVVEQPGKMVQFESGARLGWERVTELMTSVGKCFIER